MFQKPCHYLLLVYDLNPLFLDVPGPPERPSTSDIDSTRITVTWSPPSVDGGSPVTGYILERKEKTSTRWTKVNKEPVSETTLKVKDLIEGNEYEFHVAAVNKAGTGPFSEPSEPRITKPPYGKSTKYEWSCFPNKNNREKHFLFRS